MLPWKWYRLNFQSFLTMDRRIRISEVSQKWKSGNTTYLMAQRQVNGVWLEAIAFASVMESKGNFNYRQINDLCVKEEYRRKGYAKALLDYIDQELPTERKYTAVAVENDAPDWLVEMYNKRGYLIWQV